MLNLNTNTIKPEMKLGLDPEKAMRLKSAVINFIVPIVSMVLCLVLILVVIVPTYKQMPLKKSELDAATQKKQDLTTKLDNLNKLEQYKSVLDENLALVNKVLVTTSEEPKVSDEILQIAFASGMTVERLVTSGSTPANAPAAAAAPATTASEDVEGAPKTTTTPVAEPVTAKSINASLGATGNLDQLEVFLTELENAARFVGVSSFRFTSVTGKGASDDGMYTFTISLDAPYMAVNSTASTDDPVEAELDTAKYQDFIAKLKALKFYEFSSLVLTPEKPVTPVTPPATPSTPTTPVTPPAVQGASTGNKPASSEKKK